ncbi:MAG TPA: polysaccharide deacetylase family protein [Gemmatimonadaceae bacterium]|jgi:hypothetical protein
MMTLRARPLRVALDKTVSHSRAEIVYVLSTLLDIAGYAAHFSWAPENDASSEHPVDIYYGPRTTFPAHLTIGSVPWAFASAPEREASSARTAGDIDHLDFAGAGASAGSGHRFENDVVFASYWLLTGARETTWPRSRWDDLRGEGSVLVSRGLLRRAPVSRYGMHIRRRFESLGIEPLPWPWETSPATAAVSFTHDVDYPQIIRWIEVPRTLLRGKPRHAWGIARGTQHFWRFGDWVEFERRFGARPTFFFMARRGSLRRFATGTPDAFYDVRDREFSELFTELKDAGAEIGLHASFHAFRSADMLRNERERIESVAQVKVTGNRHHYWHLDPEDPNETLRHHELAGFTYDSSLGLEYYPGWRRGICHPFRPFHPGQRRAVDTVQVPPAWMDDHFDRRRSVNDISDPDGTAKELLDTARTLAGTCVVDYHARGMNADFYPRYGPWLARFAEREMTRGVHFATAAELADAYRERVRTLSAAGCDDTLGSAPRVNAASPRVRISALTPADIDGVASLHTELFGDAEFYGTSIALLGREFLARGLYSLMLDSASLHCDVARVADRVVGFTVYATNKDAAFGKLIRDHPARFIRALAIGLVKNPATLGALLGNVRYLGGERLDFLDGVEGWWIVAGVHPDARTRDFEKKHGARIAHAFVERMESVMQAAGCRSWYGVTRAENAPINALLQRFGAHEVGLRSMADVTLRYRVKRFDVPSG